MVIKNFSNWHHSFFSGLWLEVQMRMNSDDQSLTHAKFLIDILKLRKRQEILDIPCGNGRISNIMSKKGMIVTGVDFNEKLLREAKKEAKKRKLPVRFFKMNMYDIDWKNEFDAAICFWGSFGYFSEDLNMKFLKNVSASLNKNGKLLIDTITAENILSSFQERGWMKLKDIYVLQDRTYNHQNSRIDVQWTFIKKGKSEVRHSSIRLYTYYELINLLKESGFRKFTSYGSIRKDKFNFRSRRLYLVAQK